MQASTQTVVDASSPQGLVLAAPGISHGAAAATADAVQLHFLQFARLYHEPLSQPSAQCLHHLQVTHTLLCLLTMIKHALADITIDCLVNPVGLANGEASAVQIHHPTTCMSAAYGRYWAQSSANLDILYIDAAP